VFREAQACFFSLIRRLFSSTSFWLIHLNPRTNLPPAHFSAAVLAFKSNAVYCQSPQPSGKLSVHERWHVNKQLFVIAHVLRTLEELLARSASQDLWQQGTQLAER
jgi:hypothetical protein